MADLLRLLALTPLLTVRLCFAQTEHPAPDAEAPRAQKAGQIEGLLKVELKLRKSRVMFRRDVELDLAMTNSSHDEIELYNPTFSHFLMASQRAVSLYIFSEKGDLLADLLSFAGGSTFEPRKEDWVSVPRNGEFKTTFHFKAGMVPGIQLEEGNELLPGKYFLQFTAHQPFITGPPAAIRRGMESEEAMRDPSFSDWKRSFPGPEICRSNRVELEILPRTGD